MDSFIIKLREKGTLLEYTQKLYVCQEMC